MWDDGVNNYTSFRTEQRKWYVMRKTHMMSLIDSVSIKDVRDQPMFYRVRVVTMCDDGFMSCSCGGPHRYVMPCRHICNVLNDVKLFQPSLFNLRWWNKFNYFHEKTYGMELVPSIIDSMKEALKDERETCYTSDGKFKGVHVGTESLLIQNFKEINWGDQKLGVMSGLLHYELIHGPAVIGDKKMQLYISRFMTMKVYPKYDGNTTTRLRDMGLADTNIQFDMINDALGGGSQAVLSLSQYREDTGFDGNNDKMDDNSVESMECTKQNAHVSFENNDDDVAKDDIYSAYCELVQSCKTNEQKQKALTMMESLSIAFRVQNNTKSLKPGETSIYNEMHTSNTFTKRKRNRHGH